MLNNNCMSKNRDHILLVGLSLLIILLAWSGMHPYDHATWFMEVTPVFIIIPILIKQYRNYPLTSILYFLIFLHAIVLIVGGTYTYARVPLGFQMADFLGIVRNPYDKIGHFFQGFVPAIAAREILFRGDYVRGKRMLNFIVICIVLAISATYELIEWLAAMVLGQGADEFLGTQGDVWDTQSDMLLALFGAVSSLAILSRLHDSQISNLKNAN